MRIGGAGGATALAVLLFLLDKEIEDLPRWVFYSGLVICALVILLALFGGRVSLRNPVVLHQRGVAEPALGESPDPAPPPPRTPNAYDQATALQREWQGKQKRVALAQIAGELEAAQQLLDNPEVDYWFGENALEHPEWDEHAERLIEADLMALHKTVRAAYRALDAVESQGIRRGMVTSKGRKIAKLDRRLLGDAQVAVHDAIEALDGAQRPAPDWQ